MDTIIINGTIVTDKKAYPSDLLISNGKVAAISRKIKPVKNAEIIDACSCYVMPGGVDPHVHFELPSQSGPSADDFRSGSKAAIAGGTTTIIDFVTPAKGESFIHAFYERQNVAASSYIDYGLHMGITWWGDKSGQEIEQCIKREGITSFKTYLAYKDSIGINDEELIETMYAVKKHGGLLTVHCEHGDMIRKLQKEFISAGKTTPQYHPLSRPASLEAEAIFRVLGFAKIIGCRIYIVHVSTAEGMAIIKAARDSGQEVYAETCPHYLLLNDSVYKKPAEQALPYVVSPPLRSKYDNEQLWEDIQNDHIDVVATDHCPFHTNGQKISGLHDFTKIPGGVNGVEERLGLLYTFGVAKDIFSISRMVDLTSTMPARIFGLYPQKGSIAVGSDADIVIWNPDKKKTISARTHNQKGDTNIYEGFKVQGVPEYVFVNGKQVYYNGIYYLENTRGHFLPGKTTK